MPEHIDNHQSLSPDGQHARLPIVIIGAGPVGLAAAAHLRERDETPLVLERGRQVGASVREWGHVRLFSPWRYVVDEAAARLLTGTGWQSPPPDAFPTGTALVNEYLEPLAAHPALREQIRLGTEATAVTRLGLDKLSSTGREAAPFAVTTRDAAGPVATILARAVIDATGTWGQPNPLGAAGVPAPGERALAACIRYGIPDVNGAARARFAGKRVLVMGSGHSAFNVLLDLVDLAATAPGTDITWAIRKPAARLGQLFGGGIADALPARGELGARVRELVATGQLRLVTGFRLSRLEQTGAGMVARSQDQALPPVDEIIGATGFRPDLTLTAELRLALDPIVEAPVALAPLIDPNLHSCGSVPPHGAVELAHPESGFYTVGMKSYGRAPTFLLLTGYEQVRSVAAALAGDWEAAREVRLVLPETGVCSSGLVLAERGVGCCIPATPVGPVAVTAGAATTEATTCCTAAGDSLGTAAVGCCGDAVPQVIQLTAARQGACCS